jgi:hypothetical protein
MRPVAAAVVLVAWAGSAWAVCPGLDVVFEDRFDGLRPTWGEPHAGFGVADGRLVVTPASGTDFWVANTAGVYDDIDLCVTVTTVAGVEPTEAKAGVVFWYEDVNNFYTFEIAPNGRASVWRRQRGKWLPQVDWRDAESANPDDGSSNELRLTIVADTATFYINGQEFRTLDGTPPADGQQIGVFASSPEAGEATFAFDDLKVTGP